MKFDQFTDADNIKREIADSINYVSRLLWSDTKISNFLLIPRLNILFREDSDIRLFLDVTKEYKSHKNTFRKSIAISYIIIIATLLKLRLAKFFFKTVPLKVSEFYPVILGGNNRLRIIDSSNSNALLVSKNTANDFFTNNAIKAFEMKKFADLGVLPEILPVNKTLYFERQIEGLAINRMELNVIQTELVDKSINGFFEKQEKLSRYINIDAFIRYKTLILVHFAKTSKIENMSTMLETFVDLAREVGSHLGNASVNTCPSHGDLNRGNVFLDQNEVHIIDWEYYMYRYIDYDRIIYCNDLRHKHLSDYLEFFKESATIDFCVLTFLLEELSFRILNFKSDVSDSQIFIDTISMLIKQEILKGKSR